MKKCIALILLSWMVSVTTVANPVDTASARRVALNFWRLNMMQDTPTHEPVAPELQLVPTEFNHLYIFNNGTGKGWLILSADDCAHPVLAFSDEGNWPTERLPINLRGWLQGYDDEIRHVIEKETAPEPEIEKEWNDLYDGATSCVKNGAKAVSPLLTTTWGQENGYNYYCPYNSLMGQYTPTGCVATAMAQVMKYWEWPVTGVGSHSYYCSYYGTQSADFGNTQYDWLNMAHDYATYASALLLYHCGVSVDMDYGYSGSSSNFDLVVNALKNYFLYTHSAFHAWKSNYTNESWENLMLSQLDAYCPIMYGGGTNSNGHAFVCDGYKTISSKNYFHFNFGWEGDGNAYCLLTSIIPSGSNSNYTTNQDAVFTVIPHLDYWGGYTMAMYANMQASSNTVKCGDNFWVQVKILNEGSNDYTSGKWALAIFDYYSEDFVDWLSISNNVNLQSGYYSTVAFNPLKFSQTGKFYIVAFYYDSETEKYYPVMDTPDYSNELVITCTGSCSNVSIAEEETQDAAGNFNACKVFPNPTSDFIQVALSPGHQFTALQLIDEQGKVVNTQKIVSMNTKVSLDGLASGIYTVRLLAPGQNITRKVVVNK
ncbi:MAG: thiol protease/hemagglutinin PrtT [Bacteroidales bacterium]|nr:thiol protease/hemagglutinin PrtT [Bacteroidales bacterium]